MIIPIYRCPEGSIGLYISAALPNCSGKIGEIILLISQ